MFTTKEFGPDRGFNTLEEYTAALRKLEKLRTLRQRLSKGKESLTEDDIDIDSGFSSVRIQAELKPVTDKVEGIENRLEVVEDQISKLVRVVDEMVSYVKKVDKGSEGLNKDGIPNGLILHGNSKGREYRLSVDGNRYRVGEHIFASLSAAAEAVSGNRRSGYAFWKLPDGRPVREVRDQNT